jgi:hypothetical protein
MKDAIEVSIIFHEGQRMFAVPKQPAPVREPVAWVERWYGFGKDKGWWIWERHSLTHGQDIAWIGDGPFAERLTSIIVEKHNAALFLTEPAPVQPVGVTTGCASHEGFFTVVFRSQQPIPDGTDLYTTPPAQPAPVQDSTCNETLRAQDKAYPRTCKKCGKGPCIGAPKQPPSQPAPVQGLPFGVGGGLVAIKTLLSRDPCVHANTAIEMIDSILKEHPVAKQQWVGLTDEERMDCIFATNWSKTPLRDTAKLIEAKLKEKNT